MSLIPLLSAEDGVPLVSDAARLHMQTSRPHSSHLHLWRTDEQAQLLVVNGSRLFDITPELERNIASAIAQGDEGGLLARLGIDGTPLIDDQAPDAMPVHAFSLAVAQKCNLGCTYCYAQQGDFGGSAKNMPLDTALLAVDRLVD